MRLKFFNKELSKKILAGTIATVMTLSGVPKAVYAASNSKKSSNTSISSEACYDELIGTIDTSGGKFKIYKRDNGSIFAYHEGEKFTDKVEVMKDGTVNITVTERNKKGISKTTTETFKINSYTGDSIDLDESCIKNGDMKKCIKAFKTYINGTTFTDTNYIRELNYCPNETNKNKAADQVEQITAKLNQDLNKNNIKMSGSLIQPLYIQTDFIPAETAFIDVASAGVAATFLAVVAIAYEGYLILTSDVVRHSTVEAIKLASIDSPIFKLTAAAAKGLAGSLGNSKANNDDTITIPDPQIGVEEETGVINQTNKKIIAKYGTLAVAADTIMKNSRDNNENNDYYRACLNTIDDKLYIDYLNPISKSEAIKILKDYKHYISDDVNYLMSLNPSDPKKELDVFNIYTPNQKDAKNLVNSIGNGATAGTRLFQGIPECHAFINTEQSLLKNGNIIPKVGLTLNKDAKPHEYYWHYHIYTERLKNDNAGLLDILGEIIPESSKNQKHVFFGYPVIVTQNDINKYGGKKINLTDLENHQQELLNFRDYVNSFDEYMNNTSKLKIKKK